MTGLDTGAGDVAFDFVDPAAVVCRMLGLRYGARQPADRDPDLALFQQHALERIRSIIAQRRGALLCDSVGLGKTHVARSLIRAAAADGRPVLVCGPAQLAQHWRRYLRGVRGWSWLSHTALSRGRTWCALRGDALVVVDEAHAFRNPATRRYHALAVLCEDADVLLMTATPVNNALSDFHHIVRLFARAGSFADVGVPDLAAATDSAMSGGDTRMIRRVAEAVVVRRTREFVQRRYGTSLLDAHGRILSFPAATPVELVRYDLDAAYPGGMGAIGDTLLRLTFPVHAMGGTTVAAELMRLTLLKRLESSTAAFRASLRRQVSMLQQFIAAAHRGFLVDVRDQRTLFQQVDGAVQLPLDGVALRPWPRQHSRDASVRRAEHDLRLLRELYRSFDPPTSDPKVRLLRELLDDDSMRAHRVLVFTEFRDTAVMLWQALSPAGGVALIHGRDARLGSSRTTRNAVVERFAPLANGLPPPKPRERVHTLIATDVLAEGLNLQDARTVVSYDVPWNPVRLAQRIGRIDRLGSPHAQIRACVFQPDQQLDALLGLVRRVRHKLRAIRVVGGDAPRLGRRDDESCTPARDGVPQNGRNRYRRDGRMLQGNDRRWDTTETLRLEFEQRCRDSDAHRAHRRVAGETGRGTLAGDAPDVLADVATTSSVPVSAIHWPGPDPGAICCVTHGATAWFVLIRAGRAPRVGADEIDDLLLGALAAPAAAMPEPDSLAAAGRQASRAVQRLTLRQHATLAPVPEARRAAVAVHRWLASRPGGASADEAAMADRALQTIADTATTADRLRLAAITRTAGSDRQTMQRLLRLCLDRSESPRPPLQQGPPDLPRLRAILALVPAIGAHPATGPRATRQRVDP
jgi:superfamily II DNA or RNA helicase